MQTIYKKKSESLDTKSISQYDKVKVSNTEDERRSVRSIEVCCTQLKQIIDQGRNVSTRIITLELNVCQNAIINTLKRINLTFKFNRWLPHELTAEDNCHRKSCCLAVPRNQRKENILDRIETCHEKWMQYNNTSRKEGWSQLEKQHARLPDVP